MKGHAGTLTQNDMQVVRMWIGGADFQQLDALQPMQPGQYLPCSLLPMSSYKQSGHCLLSDASDTRSCFFALRT